MSFWKNLTALLSASAVVSHVNVLEPGETEEQWDFLDLRVTQVFQEAKDILEMRVDLEREVLLV